MSAAGGTAVAATVELPATRLTGDERGRLSRPRLRNWRDPAVLLALLSVTAVAVAVNLHGYPAVQDDEGTYLSQAEWTRAHGALSPYTYWYDHPPFGWMQLGAFTWLPFLHSDPLTVAGERGVMVLYAQVATLLLYLLARRVGLARPFAAAAVVLFVCSPLALTMIRQVYLDSLAVPWLLAAFYLAYSPRKHLWHFALAGGCLAGAVLTKETTAIFLPSVAFAAWRASYPKTRPFSLVAFFASFGLGCATYPLFALLKNELLAGPGHVSLEGALRFQFFERTGSGSVFDGTSSAHHTVFGWLSLDRWLIFAGLAGAVGCLIAPRLRPFGLAVALLVGTLLRGGYLPQMFVIAALPFLALCAGAVLDLAWTWTANQWREAVGPLTRLGFAATAATATAAVVLLATAWRPGLVTALTSNDNTEHALAAEYIRQSVIPRDAHVVVDNTMWQDVVHAGFQAPWGVIWYYKVDLDPAAAEHLPDGWRSIDYVVLTPFMRQDVGTLNLSTVRAAIQHSRVIASFGTGARAVELRQVVR